MRTIATILTASLALSSSSWPTSAAEVPTGPSPPAETQTQSQGRRLLLVEGDVMVSRAGGGFAKGFVGQPLQPGDRVMVGPHSLAKISYDDFCIERVRMDRIIVVQRQAPCDLEGWETVSVGEVGSISGIVGTSPMAVGIGAAALTGIALGVANTGLRPSRPFSP